MKRLFRHSYHWIRSKGRHGTHSPFVYAFVEQVMRRSNRGLPVSPAIIRQFTNMRGKEIRLLYRTICYLAPDIVFADKEQFGLLQCLFEGSGIRLEEATVAGPSGQGKVVWLTTCASEHLQELQQLIAKHTLAVLLLHPHKDKMTEGVWMQLATDSSVRMALDFWHYGLLMNSDDFKAKQYFRLR